MDGKQRSVVGGFTMVTLALRYRQTQPSVSLSLTAMLVLEYLYWMAHLLIIVCSTETEQYSLDLKKWCTVDIASTITNKKAMTVLFCLVE